MKITNILRILIRAVQFENVNHIIKMNIFQTYVLLSLYECSR